MKGMTPERPRDVPASKSQSPRTNLQLKGFWLYLARGVWIAFVLTEVVITILSLIVTRNSGLTICPFTASCVATPATAHALHQLGIAPSTYVIVNVVLALLEALVFLSVGGLIFWRKSSEPICLTVSFGFVTIGLWPFFTNSSYPPAVAFSLLSALCALPFVGYFLVTFPDGRFVPRWSWLLALLWLVQTIVFELPGAFNITSWPPALLVAELLLTYGGTIGVQIYRYLRVFSYSQRQQAKWLVFGFAALVALNFLGGFIGALVPGLGAPDSPYQLVSGMLTTFAFLLLPLSTGMAILRSRLWEIDLIIRRTLIYTPLTVVLALLYVGLVIGFSALLRGIISQDSSVAIVISTLVIAALFQPLRRRIQRLIDRRFYRSKYDAAKTLAAFSATLRQEVDLEQLREHLLAVVQETMQPSSISLWLRKPDSKLSHPDRLPADQLSH